MCRILQGVETQYEVERIVAPRFVAFRTSDIEEYCVRWRGYGAADDTWEAADRLKQEVPALVWKFLAHHQRPTAREGRPAKKTKT